MKETSQYLFKQLHNNKKAVVYKCVALLHAAACSGHLQGGLYQRKDQLWLIILEMCRYKAKTHMLNK
jgi:hypothetical protein